MQTFARNGSIIHTNRRWGLAVGGSCLLMMVYISSPVVASLSLAVMSEQRDGWASERMMLPILTLYPETSTKGEQCAHGIKCCAMVVKVPSALNIKVGKSHCIKTSKQGGVVYGIKCMEAVSNSINNSTLYHGIHVYCRLLFAHCGFNMFDSNFLLSVSFVSYLFHVNTVFLSS